MKGIEDTGAVKLPHLISVGGGHRSRQRVKIRCYNINGAYGSTEKLTFDGYGGHNGQWLLRQLKYARRYKCHR